jgi:hypothetical protein
MCRENNLVPGSEDILVGSRPERAGPEALFDQGDTQQGRMALVHVIAADVMVAQFCEDLDAADAKDRFLAQPVAGISAVEIIGERLVPGSVFGKGGVQ